MDVWKILCPVRLKKIRRLLRQARAIDVLDVGCGNHSPKRTKYWLKNARYTGADIADYNIDAEDRACMDGFVLVTPDGGGYEQIPDNAFDIVIFNHVIEHIRNPIPVLSQLCKKLRRGGYIYVAFPSLRSLSLPSAYGTLNFCDDPTHIRIVDVKEIAQTLLDNDVRIVTAGRSFDLPMYLIGAALYPVALLLRQITGTMKARGLWYFLGFEDMVLGQRR